MVEMDLLQKLVLHQMMTEVIQLRLLSQVVKNQLRQLLRMVLTARMVQMVEMVVHQKCY